LPIFTSGLLPIIVRSRESVQERAGSDGRVVWVVDIPRRKLGPRRRFQGCRDASRIARKVGRQAIKVRDIR
jgi:hypothetical protein